MKLGVYVVVAVELSGLAGESTGPQFDLESGSMAIGDAVKVTSRLQAEAQVGEVLINETTYERVHGGFEVEALGERQVKGHSQPVLAYRVVGAR